MLIKPSRDQVARMAYRLFLDQGSRDGHDLDDWLRAEQLLTIQLNERAMPVLTPPQELGELSDLEHPFAWEERGTPGGEDFCRISPHRPASRQPGAARQPLNYASGYSQPRPAGGLRSRLHAAEPELSPK